MSFFRSTFRHVSTNSTYQVSNYGPRNNSAIVFTPNNINGLTLWMDLSNSAYVTTSLGSIVSVNNRGTVISTFVPIDVVSRPTQSTVSGRKAASFDGINDILTSSAGANLFFNVTAGNNITTYTAAFVISPNVLTASVANYAYELPNLMVWGSKGWQFTLGEVAGSQARLWHNFGAASADKWVKSNTSQIASGTVFSGITRYMTGAIDLYINGTHVSGVAPGYNPTSAATTLRFGADIPVIANAAKMELCEFLLYTGTLTPAEITTLSQYFSTKWGI